MSAHAIVTVLLYVATLTGLGVPLGLAMARVYGGEATSARFGRLLVPLAWLERLIYRACGVDPRAEMTFRGYATATLVFNAVGLVVVYALQRAQGFLPLNPQGLGAVSPDSAFNTAVSFASNTNWQGYGGESTMSYATQMLALAVQNFVSAATGMAVLVALARAFGKTPTRSLGSFWVDLVRSTVYVLLPLSLVLAVFLVSQGVVQTFAPYATAKVIDAASGATDQVIALGPAASQIAIKQLGTNGGGFFNANSAHPFENPTALSNFAEVVAILLIPAALPFTFGALVGDRRQGVALYAAMLIVFVPLLWVAIHAESSLSPALADLGLNGALGNMEGKEARFGAVDSGLWAAATTAASNGSVNAMHDSLNPLGGLVPMVLIQLGEVIFGGVGSGLYGLLMFAIIAVFVAGLMVGRTPEYLGKKIEAYEMKMASLVILVPCALVLVGTAIACALPAGASGVANPGPHGFSEILYAFSSAANNNGSAFGGLSANTPFYNTLLGVAMFGARYWLIVPTLAIAGSLAKKKVVPVSTGTLPTHTPLFVALLVGTVLVVGALTFIPALALGPIVEHLGQ